MSGGFYGALLDTIGIEYEGIGISRNVFADSVISNLGRLMGEKAKQINLTRDASTEFNAEFIPTSSGRGGIWVSSHTNIARNLRGAGRGNNTVMGYEVFTYPMSVSEMESVIIPLVFTLVENGDFVSDRASIHYHIGFGNNLSLMKKLLRVVLHVEPILYRLGGMGRLFRGHSNLAAYARPLMQPAAGIIAPTRERNPMPRNLEELRLQLRPTEESRPEPRSAGKYAEIINTSAALEATTLQEFWAAFSVNYNLGGGTNKYHGCRYSGTNFYAIPQHSTIEFRHFNQSHNPYLITAVGKFLRAMVEMSTLLGKQEVGIFQPISPREELSMAEITEIMENIVNLCRAKEVEEMPTNEDMNLILETIERSSFVPLPEIPVLTHARDFYIPENLVTLGKLNLVKKVLPACHSDIHTITGRNISMCDGFNLPEGGR